MIPVDDLARQYRDNDLSRRDFVRRALALGVSAAALGPLLQSLSTPVYAARPERVDTAPFTRGGPYKIGFSNSFSANVWRTEMIWQLRYEASLHPGDIKRAGDVIITDGQGDTSKQIADIEDLLVQNIDALLLIPNSPTALQPVIRKAVRQGVPVVVFNLAMGGSDWTSYVGTDAVKKGYAWAKWLSNTLHRRGNIVAISGIAGNGFVEETWTGAQQAWKGTGIKVLNRRYGNWEVSVGKSVAADVLAAFPHIDGVWADSGFATAPFVEALLAAKRPLVPMTADDYNGFLKLWARNRSTLQGYVLPEPTWESAIALKVALQALKGRSVAKNNYMQLTPITNANIAQKVHFNFPDTFFGDLGPLPASYAASHLK